jgi:hypothetical protein
MADQGTDAMEREKQFLFASQEGRYLWHVNEALRRLYKTPDRFGLCHTCGKEINFERLDALPHARLCIECKEKERMANGAERRLYWGAILTVLAPDIITKQLAEAHLHRSAGRSVFGDWFQLRLVYNPGAAFGLHLGLLFPMDLPRHRHAVVILLFQYHPRRRTVTGSAAGARPGHGERSATSSTASGRVREWWISRPWRRCLAMADVQRGRHGGELGARSPSRSRSGGRCLAEALREADTGRPLPPETPAPEISGARPGE